MNLKRWVLRSVDPLVRIPTAGLDISDHSFKYLKFKPGRTWDVDFFDEAEIPEGMVEKGEIKREAELAQFLRAWRVRQPRSVRSSFVIASLPEEKSFLRLMQLPHVKREEIGNAVRWEIESNIPLPQEQLIYGYEIIDPLQGPLDHLDVVVTAFPKGLVESYVSVLKGAGFRPAALELESQAIIRSTVAEGISPHTTLVVDMGSTRTSFIIFSGGAIVFTTTVELGGRMLEENIIKMMGVSREQAVTLKKDVGLNRLAHDGRVFAALVPAVGALADEIKRAFEYYQNHSDHAHGASTRIERILVSGGDANLRGLDTYLASSLRVPVEAVNPFAAMRDRFRFALPPIPYHRALGFTTAVGLAMRELY